MDEIRKFSAIYGRFDCKRKPEKPLTLHEVSFHFLTPCVIVYFKTYDLSVCMIIIAKMMSDCDYALFGTINNKQLYENDTCP